MIYTSKLLIFIMSIEKKFSFNIKILLIFVFIAIYILLITAWDGA